MAEKASRWIKFKRFLKRNMTPTWAKHFAYQMFSFILSIILVIGVANYAITKSYAERTLRFVDGFTVTAHAGSFDTAPNSLESVGAAIDNNAEIFEIDVRRRPDKTLIMAHEIALTNNDGVELKDAFELIAKTDIILNLDIKETRVLDALHDMLVEYDLYNRVILTGIEIGDINAVKASSCRDISYYLNYKPSRIRIFSEDYQQNLITTLEEAGAIGINCRFTYAGGQLAQLLHTKGYKLSVWTVDKSKDMKRILTIKPDNVTTKESEKLNEIINKWGG